MRTFSAALAGFFLLAASAFARPDYDDQEDRARRGPDARDLL